MMPDMNILLDGISTCLVDGEIWHRRSGSESRRFYVRGWGRWHDAEAECDMKCMQKLHKIVGDIPTIQHLPKLGIVSLSESNDYCFPDVDTPAQFKIEFRKHHEAWLDREKRFIKKLTEAVKVANDFDTSLYQDLLCLKKEVENEAFRVQTVIGRMWLTDWADIGYVSKVLHDYFECKYDGGLIDFNIG